MIVKNTCLNSRGRIVFAWLVFFFFFFEVTFIVAYNYVTPIIFVLHNIKLNRSQNRDCSPNSSSYCFQTCMTDFRGTLEKFEECKSTIKVSLKVVHVTFVLLF